MNNATDYIREFLSHMGVTADIQIDDSNKTVIIVTNEQFNLRRAWIETWFTQIDQDDHNTYLRERPRGTGQTI